MYASVADMIDRFGETEMVELTDFEHTGEVVAAKVERALTDASAEIDGYLAARFRLPVMDTPRLLSVLCSDIARYRLETGVNSEQARQRYDDALAKLKKIQNGEINLPLASPPAVSAEPMVSPGRARVFDDDTLRGY